MRNHFSNNSNTSINTCRQYQGYRTLTLTLTLNLLNPTLNHLKCHNLHNHNNNHSNNNNFSNKLRYSTNNTTPSNPLHRLSPYHNSLNTIHKCKLHHKYKLHHRYKLHKPNPHHSSEKRRRNPAWACWPNPHQVASVRGLKLRPKAGSARSRCA